MRHQQHKKEEEEEEEEHSITRLSAAAFLNRFQPPIQASRIAALQ